MAKMRVRPHAPGTGAYPMESVWCKRIPRNRPTVDQSRILLGTLKMILRDEDDRIVRMAPEIAPGVRRRAAR